MARILVVDDEIDIVRMVAKVLGARGHQVEAGRDAKRRVLEAARAFATRRSPWTIFCISSVCSNRERSHRTLTMGRASGFETAR